MLLIKSFHESFSFKNRRHVIIVYMFGEIDMCYHCLHPLIWKSFKNFFFFNRWQFLKWTFFSHGKLNLIIERNFLSISIFIYSIRYYIIDIFLKKKKKNIYIYIYIIDIGWFFTPSANSDRRYLWCTYYSNTNIQ